MQKILLMEDDPSIIEMVHNHFIREGYLVTTAQNGEEGMEKFNDTYDLLIVDIMMPKLDGLEVIKLVRAKSHVPILVLSAKDSEVDKALGLGFGADDYIAKPFSLIELSARVKAMIRRATQYIQETKLDVTPLKDTHMIQNERLCIDLDNISITRNGEDVKLTSKEFELLKLFATNPGRVFTKAQIYSFIWQEDYYGDENVINVHIRRLREKIELDPSHPEHIKTLWGIGYKWEWR